MTRPAVRRCAATSTKLTAVALASAASLLLGCSEPQLPDGPAEDTGTSPAPDAEEPDPGPDLGELTAQVEQLGTLLDETIEQLQAAATADDVDQARAEARRALGLLLEDAGTPPSGSAPLLPADSRERQAVADREDLLGVTLALARDVGGEPGTAVMDLLRDEVAGDLGAWERDAAGVVASAERAASTPGGPDAQTDRVLELSGEATRALAWTLVAADADDPAAATTAAERAAAHLDLVRFAVDELLGQLPDEATPS